MQANILHFTDADLAPENLARYPLVLADFWASWCGPCRMLAPILEELAGETEGVTFVKVNVDEEPDAAIRLGIASIPTLILYKNGEIAERMVGLQGKEAVRAMIDRNR